MDAQLSPRLQEFWFNALPGRFMQLRAVSREGNIWEVEQAVSTILDILPKAGITDSELLPFIKEVGELRIECYAIRVGKSMALYNSMLEYSNAADRYIEIERILSYLNPILIESQNQLIAVKFEIQESSVENYTALNLYNKLREEQDLLFKSFESILYTLLSKLKEYSELMDINNPFYDLRLRTRKLEVGINAAKQYAKLLNVDISEELNDIQVQAYLVMGLDPARLQ